MRLHSDRIQPSKMGILNDYGGIMMGTGRQQWMGLIGGIWMSENDDMLIGYFMESSCRYVI